MHGERNHGAFAWLLQDGCMVKEIMVLSHGCYGIVAWCLRSYSMVVTLVAWWLQGGCMVVTGWLHDGLGWLHGGCMMDT